MTAYHPDFIMIQTASTFGSGMDFNRATHNAVWEGIQAAEYEAELTAETRAILDDICNSVASIIDDFEGDLGDYAADLDEMI